MDCCNPNQQLLFQLISWILLDDNNSDSVTISTTALRLQLEKVDKEVLGQPITRSIISQPNF
jgi:hypothetical protein